MNAKSLASVKKNEHRLRLPHLDNLAETHVQEESLKILSIYSETNDS